MTDADPVKRREYLRAWRKGHPEKTRAYVDKYRRTEKYRALLARRNARLRAATAAKPKYLGPPIPKALREQWRNEKRRNDPAYQLRDARRKYDKRLGLDAEAAILKFNQAAERLAALEGVPL